MVPHQLPSYAVVGVGGGGVDVLTFCDVGAAGLELLHAAGITRIAQAEATRHARCDQPLTGGIGDPPTTSGWARTPTKDSINSLQTRF